MSLLGEPTKRLAYTIRAVSVLPIEAMMTMVSSRRHGNHVI